MSLYRLVHHIGSAKARQLVLWGREIAVERCVELGLIDQVSEDLHEAVRATIRDLALQPGSELAIRRRLLLEATSSPFEDALGTHLAACDRELRRLRAPGHAAAVPAKPKL
jgi:isomerase DpgB